MGEYGVWPITEPTRLSCEIQWRLDAGGTECDHDCLEDGTSYQSGCSIQPFLSSTKTKIQCREGTTTFLSKVFLLIESILNFRSGSFMLFQAVFTPFYQSLFLKTDLYQNDNSCQVLTKRLGKISLWFLAQNIPCQSKVWSGPGRSSETSPSWSLGF